MRRYLALTLCLLLLASIALGCTETPKATKKTPLPEPKTGKPRQETIIVTRVIDGDTIEVSIDGKTEKVRLIGIDAPEQGRPFFEESTNKAKELLEGKEVQLLKDVSDRDKYGRLLRYVFAGSTFVNAELVRQGYANVYTYPPDVKYSDLFVKYEREAREGNRGLWAQEEKLPEQEAPPEPAPTPPPAPQPEPQKLYVKVVSVTSPVSAGANATLIANSLPGATCSITVYYKSGPSEAQGLYDKQGDNSGNVSWTWKVGTRTTPGSWEIVVTATLGGQSASTSTSFDVQ